MLPSRDFERWEFACKCGCGFDTIDAETLDVLVCVRKHYGKPVHITSACRCLEYNFSIDGSSDSQHMYARAVDFWVETVPASEVQQFLLESFPDKYGIGCYPTFTHLDTKTGPPRRWSG